MGTGRHRTAGDPAASGQASDALLSAARTSLLLGELAPDDVARILGLGRIEQYERGETILRESDDAAVLLLDGAAKEHGASRDGTDFILDLLGPGDTTGLLTVLEAGGSARVTALEHSAGLIVPGSGLRRLQESRPAIAQTCLRVVAAQAGTARERALLEAGSAARDRVIGRLLELAGRWGSLHDGSVMVRLRLSQEELAAWAGVSRESTAKVLADLRRQGLLATGRREYYLRDLAVLEARQHGRAAPGRDSSDASSLLAGWG